MFRVSGIISESVENLAFKVILVNDIFHFDIKQIDPDIFILKNSYRINSMFLFELLLILGFLGSRKRQNPS